MGEGIQLNRRSFMQAMAAGIGLGLPLSRLHAAAPPRLGYPRWACLNWGLASTGAAMGAPPIALSDLRGYNAWAQEPVLPDWTAGLGARIAPNLEALQALRPDFIVTSTYYQSIMPQLDAIAPVLCIDFFAPNREPMKNAYEGTRVLAERLGMPEAAERLIEKTEQTIQDAAAQIPAKPELDVMYVSILDPGHLRVFGESSLFNAVVKHMPIRSAWEGSTNYWGFSTIGVEELAAFEDVHLCTSEPVPEPVQHALKHSAIWKNLPSIRKYGLTVLPSMDLFGGLPVAMRYAKSLAKAFGRDSV